MKGDDTGFRDTHGDIIRVGDVLTDGVRTVVVGEGGDYSMGDYYVRDYPLVAMDDGPGGFLSERRWRWEIVREVER